MPRHCLTGAELSTSDVHTILDRAAQLKAAPLSSQVLAGKSVALIFQKPSTRTRLSFDAGVHELGGHPMVIRADEMQLSRGESPADTARILSRHAAAVGIRTNADSILEAMAETATIPIVNMLTDGHHPCQALADLLTMRETFGSLDGLKLAYVGDGNNVARSLAIVGTIAGIEVAVASPEGYELEPEAGGTRTTDPYAAVAGAHAVYTDVWVSMGDEDTAAQRTAALRPYRIDDALLDAAAPNAIALHCLPAHPGDEITSEVLYGDRERIWDQAENRRHAQKALLEFLVSQG